MVFGDEIYLKDTKILLLTLLCVHMTCEDEAERRGSLGSVFAVSS